MTARDRTSVRRAVRAALDGGGTQGRFVLAVSGGVDSMVLLDAVAGAIPAERLTVATFDHGTGPAATSARALVEERAMAIGIECAAARADRVLSSEAELRGARWEFLQRVASDRDAEVCTAHTADDQVETVLMRVLRGAGARGLAGLYADGTVVRPLLQIGRADVLRYARARGVEWLEDPSNQSPRYLRNRVRRDLLPAMRRVRPSIDGDLLVLARQAAEWRRETEALVDRAIDLRERSAGKGLDISVASLRHYSDAGLCVIWPVVAARVGLVLDRRGTSRAVEFTRLGGVGRRIQVSGGWEVVRSRDALELRASAQKEPTPAELELSNRTEWGEWSFHPANDESGNVGDGSWSSWLPTDRPLVVRRWQPGDTMARRTGATPQKVKRILSDAGVTGHQRAHWPVVLTGDQIVWIPGVCRGGATTDRSGRPGLSFICDYVNR
ncbi:MAG: tRNA lysidine(34) synthetase TilS [bacterium]